MFQGIPDRRHVKVAVDRAIRRGVKGLRLPRVAPAKAKAVAGRKPAGGPKRQGNMPMAYWRLGQRTARMMAEAQTVVTLRILGLAGFWPVPQSEHYRMVFEKAPAFMRAGSNATVAALRGERADRIAAAALRPVSARTHANAQRLLARDSARKRT
jgi:hypothetical protein